MAQVDLSDYKALYIQTTKETIANLLEGCDKLTNNLRDEEALKVIHINSHSLKSRSQVMGFMDTANICLDIEKMSDDALKGIIQLNNENISEIKASVGKLNEMLKHFQHDIPRKTL